MTHQVGNLMFRGLGVFNKTHTHLWQFHSKLPRDWAKRGPYITMYYTVYTYFMRRLSRAVPLPALAAFTTSDLARWKDFAVLCNICSYSVESLSQRFATSNWTSTQYATALNFITPDNEAVWWRRKKNITLLGSAVHGYEQRSKLTGRCTSPAWPCAPLCLWYLVQSARLKRHLAWGGEGSGLLETVPPAGLEGTIDQCWRILTMLLLDSVRLIRSNPRSSCS